MMCLVPEVFSLCELPQSHAETTTKCSRAKLHVSNICSGHNVVKLTQAVAVAEIVVLFQKCHLSHCHIHNYEERHLIPLALAGIR